MSYNQLLLPISSLVFPLRRSSSHFVNLKLYRSLSHSHLNSWEEPIGFDTGIKVHHPLSRKKVRLILKNDGVATWYACGPTVYDSAHIGHASCFVKFDIIQRILRKWFDINVVTAMSITDIDEKIIKKSQTSGEDLRTITRHYEMEFYDDLNSLNVRKPIFCTRVTDYMAQIISFVNTIVNQGCAYRAEDGSVYFDTSKLPNYGKLVSIHDTEEPNEEASESNKHKKSAKDFALWKCREMEPFWESPWGRGIPGWHIECSTMASAIFGSNIDIHSGGIDLKFPHHENEEAQSCTYHSCKQWTNYWLHSGHLQFKGDEKMSRSLKNVMSISDMLDKYSADQFRVLCLLSPYRRSIEFSDESMVKAIKICKKIEAFLGKCNAYINGQFGHNVMVDESSLIQALKNTKAGMRASFCDDFNTANAMTDLMDLISLTHKNLDQEVLDENLNPITVGSSLAVIGAVRNFVMDTIHDLGLTIAKQKVTSEISSNADLGSKDQLISNVIDLSVGFRRDVKNTLVKMSSDNLKEQKGEFIINS
ncbi:probable cysteine--tRNA ligase, mitochondrial [Nilaparvata lugens]|uniref:probable cysteine--tRNA ligase, mitochondrial n=1 Tax=Nilaparvata lugens TaxID=108931 RepID=UPI00193D6C96|nr:probable cysteine--tRNA ligase, mitochondrial [Nilaparvata lugens]